MNAWISHAIIAETLLSLLNFKSAITTSYLKISSPSDPKAAGRPKKLSANVATETRLYPTGHVLERTNRGKQRKCAVCKKKSVNNAGDAALVFTWANVFMTGIAEYSVFCAYSSVANKAATTK